MTLTSSSDSGSDLEVLAQLSDWDSTSDSDDDDDDDIGATLPQKQSPQENLPKEDILKENLPKEGLPLEDPSQRSNRTIRVNYMQSLEDAEFTFRFRLSKSAVNSLLTEIMPFVRVTSSRNHGVAPLHQLLLTLRFYALGTMLVSVADFVGVSKSTAGRIVKDISSAISSLYDKYIFMHLEGAPKFYNIAGFPRVLGAIDGTHVQIQSPSRAIGAEYKNRNGYYSLNVQTICDADLRFMSVVAHWPGSTNDATAFNNSIIRAQCESGQFENHWIVGDSAYPNRPYLLTPILNPANPAEQRYNTAHARARYAIERTIGDWKQRFPVIALKLRLSLPVAKTVVVATAVLHNICRNYNIGEIPPEVDLPVTSDSNDDNYYQNIDIQSIETRANLIHNYFA